MRFKKFRKKKYRYTVLDKTHAKKVIYNEFFESEEFLNYVKETALLTGIDEEKVLHVLLSYFLNTMYFLNIKHKTNVKLNIYSFFSILIYKTF